jgi:hypothetical protein
MHVASNSSLSTSLHEQGDRLIIANSQDCTPIAEYAKAQHNAGYHGSSEVKHAARIPLVIVQHYCNTHGVTFAEVMTDTKHIKRMCEDPANAAFRIWPGAL